MATWLDQLVTGLNNRGRIWHMFQHFHAGHNVVLASLFLCQLLDRHLTVFDIADAFLLGMKRRHFRRGSCSIDAKYFGSSESHSCSQNAAISGEIHDFLAAYAIGIFINPV